MGFNRRKMEDRRQQASEKEAAERRALEGTATHPRREQNGGFCINSEARRCINFQAARL